jgi:putative transposase
LRFPFRLLRLENQTLAQEIDLIHARSRQTYGSPRVMQELRKKGRRHGRHRIARLMQEKGLCGRQKGRHRVQTTDSNHDHPIAPNRLAEAPKATAPNQLWVADITYIETKEGWLYLAAILDLYSRKIVGWAMSERIDTSLVLKSSGHGSAASRALRPICSSIPIAASNTPAAISVKPSVKPA